MVNSLLLKCNNAIVDLDFVLLNLVKYANLGYDNHFWLMYTQGWDRYFKNVTSYLLLVTNTRNTLYYSLLQYYLTCYKSNVLPPTLVHLMFRL